MIFIPHEGRTALNWYLWRGSIMGSTFWGWRVHLCNYNVPFTTGMTLADLTPHEATFNDYFFRALAFQADAGINPDGFSEYLFNAVDWVVGAGGGTDTIQSYWVDGISEGGTRRLLWCELLPVPVPMITPGSPLAFVPRFGFRQA